MAWIFGGYFHSNDVRIIVIHLFFLQNCYLSFYNIFLYRILLSLSPFSSPLLALHPIWSHFAFDLSSFFVLCRYPMLMLYPFFFSLLSINYCSFHCNPLIRSFHFCSPSIWLSSPPCFLFILYSYTRFTFIFSSSSSLSANLFLFSLLSINLFLSFLLSINTFLFSLLSVSLFLISLLSRSQIQELGNA